MKRKLTSLLAMLAMLMSLVTLPQTGAQAAANWDGNGTSGDPYEIETYKDLVKLQATVSAGETWSGTYFALTDNIEMQDQMEGMSWTPIGTEIYQFAGTFSGGGYTISGLFIDPEYSGSSLAENNQGLFGYVASGATIETLAVEGTITGKNNVGLICGNNYGTITDCIVKGTVTSTSQYAGGICGYNAGKIERCANAANVTCTVKNIYSSCVGGICGYNTDTVQNCYNTGDIIGCSGTGGIVGESYAGGSDSTIANCYSIGKISTTSEDGGCVGGIVGNNNAGSTYVTAAVTNCYYLTGTASGGINGTDSTGAAEEKTADEMADEDTYTGWDFSGAISTWKMSTILGRPVLYRVSGITMDTKTSAEDPFEIATADDLVKLQTDVNNFILYADAYFKMTDDISLSSVCGKTAGTDGSALNWTPIGGCTAGDNSDDMTYFSGTFDGDGHTISDLYINDSTGMFAGLFGYTGAANGENKIMNLTVDGEVTGAYVVGGIAACFFTGTIENCTNKAAVTCTGSTSYSFSGGIAGMCGEVVVVYSCSNFGTISGGKYVGGIAASGWIENCYNEGSVSTEVSGGYAGGIAGYCSNKDAVKFCYSQSTGNDNKNTYGIVGAIEDNYEGHVKNCYYSSAYDGQLGAYGTDSTMYTTNQSDQTTEVTDDELKSGEITWLLNSYSNADTTLDGLFTGDAWYQTIGEDETPLLDSTRGVVHKVAFMTKDTTTTDDDTDYATYAEKYVNDGEKVTLPDDPTSYTSASGKIYNFWYWATDASVDAGKKFDEDSAIESDLTLYAVGLIGGSNPYYGVDGEITVSYGDGVNGNNLGNYVKVDYNGEILNGGDLFDYTIVSGNSDELGAYIGDYNDQGVNIYLYVPMTAMPGVYELTIGATYKNRSNALSLMSADNDTDYDLTFTYTITVNKLEPTYSAPAKAERVYTGEAMTLIAAGTVTDGDGKMVYSLDGETYSEEVPTAVNAGEYTVYYKVLETDTYKGTEVRQITAEIEKADPEYTAPKAVSDLKYTGEPLTLVTAGTVTKGGEMLYSLDGEGYNETIPTADAVGEYTVYYMVYDKDGNYDAAEGSVKVTVSKGDVTLKFTYSDNKITAVRAVNLDKLENAATMYIAQYDKDGVLIKVNTVSVSDDSTITLDSPIEITENTDSYAAFLWDSQMKPLCK